MVNVKDKLASYYNATLGDDFVAAKPTGICACTDLTRDQIVTQIRAKGLKTSKEVRHVLDFKDKNGCPKSSSKLLFKYGIHMTIKMKRITLRNERTLSCKHSNDGTFSVIPQMRRRNRCFQLIRLVKLQKYNVPLVKVTGSQRVGLYGLKKEELPKYGKI